MPQVINTNIASLNAQRNLNTSQSANQTAMERLSSGLRINSAADDAAGLAISTRFTSQINGLTVATRNANDGISLVQTAEGALSSINENLQRIRELAVQSSNATNSDVDREALQAEVDQLVAEIGRTAEDTDFNGSSLLDGSFSATFQVGANAGQTVDVSISELTAEKLGSSDQSGVSAQGVGAGLENGDLNINGVAVGASIAGDDDLSYANKEMSAISKAAAINEISDETGVTATVDENVMVGSDMSEATTAAASATVTVNGVDISIQGTANSTEAEKSGTRNSVVAAINAKSDQTGVTASDGGESGGVVLTAADGRNITLESTTADLSVYGLADSDTGATTAENSYAGFTLTAKNANTDIVITGGNDTGNGNIENSGLQEGTYSAQTAYASTTEQSVGAASDDGLDNDTAATVNDLTTIGTEYGLTFAAAAGTTTAEFQDELDAAGYDNVTLAGNTVNDLRDAVAQAAASDKALDDGDLVINGVAIQASSALDDTASDTTASSSDASASGIAIAAAINAASEDTGVTATVNATVVSGGEATATLGSGGSPAVVAAGGLQVGATFSLFVNDVEVQLTETGDYETNKANAITAINSVSGQTGVVAEDNGETLTLTAEDGRNISLFADVSSNIDYGGGAGVGSMNDVGTAIQNFGLSSDSVGQDLGDGGTTNYDDDIDYSAGAKTTYSTVTLESANGFEVSYGTNGSKGLEDSGFQAGTYGGGEDGQSLADIDITTYEGAQMAITAVDNAIQQVATQRADLGAVQNRLESTVSNLAITSENLSSANSRIQDADFAAETAEMSRTSVLQQAGISVLAQANAAGQNVLSLLG